jgi:hypothetical protein
MKRLLSYVAAFRERVVAPFHRSDRLRSDFAERRARWNQTIAEYQKPLERQKDRDK